MRAVTHLAAEAGVAQFLETGAMVPHAETTHGVVQAIEPSAYRRPKRPAPAESRCRSEPGSPE
jgi:hypothetical protein